jgi:hypothetical protein
MKSPQKWALPHAVAPQDLAGLGTGFLRKQVPKALDLGIALLQPTSPKQREGQTADLIIKPASDARWEEKAVCSLFYVSGFTFSFGADEGERGFGVMVVAEKSQLPRKL